MHQLTPRETEVAKMIAEGKRNRSIAFSLGISEQTVKNHVSRVLLKLDAKNRTQVAIKMLNR